MPRQEQCSGTVRPNLTIWRYQGSSSLSWRASTSSKPAPGAFGDAAHFLHQIRRVHLDGRQEVGLGVETGNEFLRIQSGSLLDVFAVQVEVAADRLAQLLAVLASARGAYLPGSTHAF